MKLRELAHARAGDKGDISNIAVIAYEKGDYAYLREVVTAERVKAHFARVVQGQVARYELPGLGALNFVMQKALGGGVTRSLALDPHGKSLSSLLLELDVPDRQRGLSVHAGSRTSPPTGGRIARQGGVKSTMDTARIGPTMLAGQEHASASL